MATKSTAAKPAPAKTPVSAVKHKDQRKNIPTEELRDFVSDDERAPKKQLYPARSVSRSRNWYGKARTSRMRRIWRWMWCRSTSRKRFIRWR